MMQPATFADPVRMRERVLHETFVRAVEWHEELASTNDRALQSAGDAAAKSPRLIIAGRQTAGRGRGANRWWSAPGALTFSLLLKPDPRDLPLSRWPELSLTMGTAVCEALQTFAPAAELRLKWPNDVYLEGRKVCGILVEVPAITERTVVIGIGINVNNSLHDAPPAVQLRATAFCDFCQSSIDGVDVLVAVLRAIDEQLELLVTAPDRVRSLWRTRDFLAGRVVAVEQPQGDVTGTAAGLEDDGALLLHTAAGVRRIYSGVVKQIL